MSVRQFERRHPTLTVGPALLGRPELGFVAKDRVSGLPVAIKAHSNPARAIYDLSDAVYRLAALDAMEAQGWKDKNLGVTGIGLDAHHLTPRSKGRNDSAENLAGVSRSVHDAQHGQVEFKKAR